jgi:transcriptional regulator with XRE-family HTH domain
MIVFTLKEYLAQLEREQLSRSASKRKHVPNFSQLAEMSGLTFQTISKIANNRSKSFNFKTRQLIIMYLRRTGFPTELRDIIRFQMKES